jgi:hypothetical protein
MIGNEKMKKHVSFLLFFFYTSFFAFASGHAYTLSVTGHMGFLDYKYSVNVDAEDGWVRFELPGMTAEGALMICEPSTGWKRSPTMAQLNSPREVSFRLDSAPLPLRNPSKDSIVEQCFRFAPGSTRGHKDTKDTALYIKAAPGKAARISHIIWEAGNKEPPLG